jgi:hypothetical protein
LSSFSSVWRSFALSPDVLVPVLVLPGVVVVAAPLGETPPAVVVGMLAPPLGVVVTPVDVVVPGTFAGVVVVLTPGTTAVVVGAAGVLAAGAATVVVVVAAALQPEPPASLTSAAASTPSASTATTAIVAIGVFQLGVAASRVRAAAPQRKHQSWSGFSGAPHSGQASGPGTRTGGVGAYADASAVAAPSLRSVLVESLGGAAATVTSRPPAGG